jgi:hypothetical protein
VSAPPQPGWYADPQAAGTLRYWDGARWTESRVPAQGAGYPGYSPPPAPKTSGKAIAALVLGLVWVYGITSVLAIVFAVLAKRDIRDSNGWVTGGGMATAGLVLGIIGVVGLAVILIVVFLVDPGIEPDGTRDFRPGRDFSPNRFS